MRRAWLPLAILGLAALAALSDRESGVGAWRRLQGELDATRLRVERLEQEIAALRAESAALASDELAIERAIRNDLELARPGEVVVQVAEPEGP